MRNKHLLFFLLLIVSFLPYYVQTQAQTFTLSIVAKSPGDLKLNYTNAKTWPISSGLNVVPLGKKVYFSADTSGTGITYSWLITQVPSGSSVKLDSTGTKGNSFTPDMTGAYVVSVTAGGKTATANLFVSTFHGITLTQNCAPCHQGDFNKFPQWDTSLHATMYKRGITGNLAVSNGMGLYGNYCVKCHTLNWDSTAANGNFGDLAHKTGWDTAWVRPGTLDSSGTIRIPQGDSTRWVRLRTQFQTVEPTANIGCETCHGPAADHAKTGNPQLIAVSLSGGVCNQCHDAPPGYPIGAMWKVSTHSTLPHSAEEAGRTICYPCHSGAAFVKFTKNKATPGYNAATDNFPSISCATCHDPHTSTNFGLRTLTLDSLANGYKPTSDPSFKGGLGVLCMNCHHARENTVTRVTNQAKKFTDRFYPHYSPQSDMFVGANAWEYNLNLTGKTGPHKFMQDACVTCHMADDPSTQFGVASHEMRMTDDKGNDRVYVCKPCHAEVTGTFDDKKASKDYDGDGTTEGIQTEMQHLLDKLKAVLPQDTTGEVVTRASDSMIVKNNPNYPRVLAAMYDYWFVKNDLSLGVHNAPYAAAILQASFDFVTGIEPTDKLLPATYSLSQNFPNPFNPTTTISFSIPVAGTVNLTVYDELGNQIATLHNGYIAAGNYKYTWNASNLASGVYFYKLTAEKFTLTKKMILLK